MQHSLTNTIQPVSRANTDIDSGQRLIKAVYKPWSLHTPSIHTPFQCAGIPDPN